MLVTRCRQLHAGVMHGDCAARLSLHGLAYLIVPYERGRKLLSCCGDSLACGRACSIERAGQWVGCNDFPSLARPPPAAPLCGAAH